jgi:hypothetical protein
MAVLPSGEHGSAPFNAGLSGICSEYFRVISE